MAVGLSRGWGPDLHSVSAVHRPDGCVPSLSDQAEGTVMESMPAPQSAVTVGVDTHLDHHLAAVPAQAGGRLDTQAFPASTRGYVALVTWAERFGPVERIGVEGTGTYGAG